MVDALQIAVAKICTTVKLKWGEYHSTTLRVGMGTYVDSRDAIKVGTGYLITLVGIPLSMIRLML